ncbi:MAG: GNAT family N-acetyltransferase [Candidatus Edwardsbacteria bacterium GWF2_54_11]|uniref:GNAT family N-acetyltransferase n=1 Tax=Candidatus Edwardsbacteria bacterium GWF2_54_11 TaxID=1817851 RepID=A0A1F5REM1_9BACT|nr:MAG: GNAT family N-acetyltransferase [Candidatus Edwardsbacteria bacterium GWF2_54_11]
MRVLTDKTIIESFLRQNPALHLYELGDLDDFFFPYTTWYGHEENGEVKSIALLYIGTELPVHWALDQPGSPFMEELLAQLAGELPDRLYCHLTPGLEEILKEKFSLESHGTHHKMVLSRPEVLKNIDTAGTTPLGASHREEISDFYAASYPDNWFDARMLETGQYFGLRKEGRLASIAGIHVYSQQYKVAALGNIATWPELRGQGLGTKATAALCQNLLQTVDVIGLNVKADNAGAIRCYRRLGFETCGEYGEFMAYRT